MSSFLFLDEVSPYLFGIPGDNVINSININRPPPVLVGGAALGSDEPPSVKQGGACGTVEASDPFVWCQRGNSSAPRRDYPLTKGARIPKCCPSRVSYHLCLPIDAVETQHQWLLSARYAAARERASHESVADCREHCFLEEIRGAFSSLARVAGD